MKERTRQNKRKNLIKGIGPVQFVSLGLPHFHWSDLYHLLLTISWCQFFGIVGLMYLATNFLFALAYLAIPDGIANAQPGSLKDAFFFSIQTMATIGYGSMYPTIAYTHILVAFEALFGLLGFAMATGLTYARFSKPTARVLFSRVATICPYNGVPTLMFRVANQRTNWIVEAQIRVSVLLNEEITTEGHSVRRLQDLKLVRSQTPMLALSWMVMHQIDETSPLYRMTSQELEAVDFQIVVMLTGLDDLLSQTIHARQVYIAENVLWDVRFVDVLYRTPDGQRHIDYTHFHDVAPLLTR